MKEFLDILQLISHDFYFYIGQYLDRYTYLLPLGIIGVWRWLVWLMKESVGLSYKPATKEYKATVSIITPVYNENPEVFTKALASWVKNGPTEIIAVIDYTDKTCIAIFKNFAKTFKNAKLIVTQKPGKRPALADGIAAATSDIVALVDSDTIWAPDVMRNGLPPFHNKKIAGVATYQSVLNPKTFAQKIFDIQLDLRYRHEYPFLAAAGNALVCLSGRTAFYRRKILVPMLPQLINETFFGKKVISGDDKRLTYLVLAAGWHVAFQSNAVVYTPGMDTLGSYIKQRLRWTRNSLRADLRALYEGWPLRHPALFFFQIDKVLQSFIIVLSPIYFFVAIFSGLWISAGIIFIWWFVSRTIKIYSHLAIKPQNIVLVPGYVFFSFAVGLIKIFALFSLNTQGWITRWDSSRLPQLRFLTSVPAYAGTVTIVFFLTIGVYLYKSHTYFTPHQRQQNLITTVFQSLFQPKAIDASTKNIIQKQLLTQWYVTKPRETLTDIATKLQIDADQLFYANSAKLPNPEYPLAGTTLTIPGKDMQLVPQANFPKIATVAQPLAVTYDKDTNTLLVTGRGQQVTLATIRDNGGAEYLQEITPRQWYTSATIYIYNGVTLTLDKREVEWLRLESNKYGFTMLRAFNADIRIDGVKITSWDLYNHDYDRNMDDGRAFVMVKTNSRMDIYESELAYLGFPTSPDLAVSPYGVSWKMSKDGLKNTMLTGEVIDSKFHHNYFGAYTWGATGMTWRGNQFYANTRYGLDPHDDSNGFVIEKNIAHNNGSHGIILSKRCMYNIIRDNVSYDNTLHGIMLHETSNYNLVENNILTNNTSGIAIWRSSNNIVQNNTVKKNRHGIRMNVNSDNNLIANNTIADSALYGFYLYDEANKNTIKDNKLTNNKVGMYVKSSNNTITKNTLVNNSVGIYLLGKASENVLSENDIRLSKTYGIYTKIEHQMFNSLGYNTLSKNRKDILGQ